MHAALTLVLLAAPPQLRAVPFDHVTITDEFFKPRLDTNRAVTVPACLDQCEKTHRLDNFAIAAGIHQGKHEGYLFNDSDVYKVIEGAAYSLATGALLWSTPLVPEGQNGGGVLGQPSVDLHTGKVYVATGAPYAPQPGDNPGTDSLVELRLRDGKIVWADQVHAGDQLGLDLNSSPVLVGALALVAGKDGFRAWNRITRRRLWHDPSHARRAELPSRWCGWYS